MTLKFTIVSTVALLLQTTTSLLAVTPPFSENFDSGSAPDFSLHDAGEWSFSGGAITNSEPGNGNEGAGTVQVTGGLAGGIKMTTTVNASNFDGNDAVGFGAFGSASQFDLFSGAGQNHYLADFFATGGGMRILKIPTPCCGGLTTINQQTGLFSFDTSETYELTFLATPDGIGGLNLSLTLNDPSEAGPVTITGHDPTPLTGQNFGYRTRSDLGLGGTDGLVATYDNFELVAPADATPAQTYDQVVNVDVNQPSPASPTYDGKGAAVDSGTFWNAGTFGTGSHLDLTASDGTTPTSIDIAASGASLFFDDGSANALHRDRLVLLSNNPSGNWALSDLEIDREYDLFFYSNIDTTFTANAGILEGVVSESTVSGELMALALPDHADWIEGTHYAHLRITPTTGMVSGTYTPLVAGGQAAFNGLQVARVAEPVPEPASIALWGILGLVAVGFGVWRRRKR